MTKHCFTSALTEHEVTSFCLLGYMSELLKLDHDAEMLKEAGRVMSQPEI